MDGYPKDVHREILSRYVVTVSIKAQFLTRLQKFERRRQAFHFN